MKKLILKSRAKLNLYLEVLNSRLDGYHNIKTIFERIDLADEIILKARRDKQIKISCNSGLVPCDKSNLTYRAANLLQDTFGIDKGVDIKIIKHIPVASGLGGGSSNAASVFLGLNKLWQLNLQHKKLVSLAKRIGSDVPFFIYNSSFAKGGGRGDKIKPLKAVKGVRLWHILIVPKIKVSTPLIYKKWDEYCGLTPHLFPIQKTFDSNKYNRSAEYKKGAGLTKPKLDVRILNLALKKKDIRLLGKVLFNNLQAVTSKLYPEIRQIKEKLTSLGLKSISMSGSGPAMFGIVSCRKEAVSLYRKLKRENRSWQIFAARTV